jgi:colicin import membrane protein
MKKKTSVYFVIPILCVIAFGGYYWTFLKAHNAKEEARVKKIDDDKKAKAAKQAADAQKAYDDALAIRQKKDAEKLEKTRIADEEKKAKIDRKEALSKAQQDADKLLRTIDDKRADQLALTKEIAELELQKKALAAEVGLVRDSAKQSQENAKKAQDEVLQYERAKAAREELARQAAAAAAAAAAKK